MACSYIKVVKLLILVMVFEDYNLVFLIDFHTPHQLFYVNCYKKLTLPSSSK